MRSPLLRAMGLFLLLVALPFIRVHAQVVPVYSVAYRPPGLDYLVMRSAHFDIIYQVGTESQARELAAVLESTLPDVSEVFPTRASFRLAVVLNRFGDRGNGFVATVPFKSEVDGVAIFGRTLSVRHSDWLYGVGPHELVHAAQADYTAGFGVHTLLRPFSADVARALNMWVPPGIAEGAAVYLESSLEPRAGRLNHPWFEMDYRAAAGAGRPWSMAQMLERPWYTRPTDRYYRGGAALMETLADSTGDIRALRRATAFHNRFPFLGYGASFWYGTGQLPRTFGAKLRREAVRVEQARQEALGPLTESRLVSGRKGQVIRHPRWISDTEVIAYMTAYDRRRGLFRIDMETGTMDPVAYQDLTEDLQFALSPDGRRILASRYTRDPFSSLKLRADAFQIDVGTGRSQRLSTDAGLLSPVELPDGRLWAIQLDGAYSNWVVGTPEQGFEPVLPAARHRFKAIEPSPDFSQAAVVLNVMGSQGLYLSDAATPALTPAVVFENGSVYDARWSPSGDWVIFSADPTDVVNLYALRVSSGAVYQLTNVAYGAAEGVVSPDGTQLAFVEFADQRFDLRVMPFRPEAGSRVAGTQSPVPAPGSFVDTTGVAVLAGAYRPLSYVKPRMAYPTVYLESVTREREGTDLGVGVGLALQAVDPLATWSYWMEGIYQGDRAWGEVGATTASTILRPRARLYRRPDQFLGQIGSGASADTLRVIRDRRGAEFSVSVPVTLQDNIHRSSASFGLFFNLQENRLLGRDNAVLRDWTSNLAITPVARFSLGLQSALRDLIWSRGVTFVTATEFEFVPERYGGAATASYNELGVFLPWLSRLNTGMKIELAALSQTRGFVYNTDFFMPRGHEDRVPGRGTSLRGGFEAVQPLVFPDNGLMIVPSFFRVVYAYGFAERLVSTGDWDAHLSTVGGGLGVQLNLLHVLELDFRIGRAYRTGDSPALGWTTVYR